jgi:uncharacterized protein YdaU (DUF1376 family)
MAEFPALPLWTDVWVADTKHLSRHERGTYLDLLILMWRTPGCRVPNDDSWLGKHLGMTPVEVVNELRPLIEEFCTKTGTSIFQKRLLHEFEFLRNQSKSQSIRAKSRWRNKKDVYPNDATGMHPAYAASGIAPTPTPTPTPEERKQAALPPISTVNGGLQPEVRDAETELFRRGREVLGQQAGGMIAKLLAAKGRNVALARAAIETASTKENPREYLAAIIRGREPDASQVII